MGLEIPDTVWIISPVVLWWSTENVALSSTVQVSLPVNLAQVSKRTDMNYFYCTMFQLKLLYIYEFVYL